MKKRKKLELLDIIVYAALILVTLIILYPLYFTVIASLSEPSEVVQGKVIFWIKGFTIESYVNVFENKDIWLGYYNNIVYTVFGTLLAMALTIPAAYALSKKYLWKRNLVVTYFIIVMYFSGGLLPSYLQVKNLDLLNKPYTLIILGSFSVYNLVIARTYFQTSIPESLYEAAEIDGCSQIGAFFKIALPLAKPIIAVITLYYAVGRWNNYFSALIYVSKSKYHPLQMVLRSILMESKNALANIKPETMEMDQIEYFMQRAYMAEAMKYSIILIASLPMLILYPFIQKHFIKGMMVGAVKG